MNKYIFLFGKGKQCECFLPDIQQVEMVVRVINSEARGKGSLLNRFKW